jgi:lipopolysaccharide biosynthesis protein
MNDEMTMEQRYEAQRAEVEKQRVAREAKRFADMTKPQHFKYARNMFVRVHGTNAWLRARKGDLYTFIQTSGGWDAFTLYRDKTHGNAYCYVEGK